MFTLMKQPRPQTGAVDVESMMREFLAPSRSSSVLLKDPPPKYEELGQEESPPPKYQENLQELQQHHQGSPPPDYQESLSEELQTQA